MSVFILATFVVGSPHWAVAHPIFEKSLFIIGITLAGLGAAGRAWATSYISGRKMKHLVTNGPYSLCRNPLYLFSMILGIGFGFCTQTLTAPCLIALVLTWLYYVQIKREEQELQRLFGREYESYLASIPCFVPSHRRYAEPDIVCISPRLMRKGLFGIAFLLILIGVLEVLEVLHQFGFLPIYFRVY
jgi:protein-S-isoprenylcysteine O-methyltransferase Ste14